MTEDNKTDIVEAAPRLNIHQRIHAVMKEVDYVQKTKPKDGMKYSSVSHDSVTAAIRPELVKHGVIYYPQNLKQTQEGNRTTVTLDLCFACIDDPKDCLIVPSFGFGIDAQDKGPGKAISYAVKYAILKTFGLETGDDPENDDINHDKNKKPAEHKSAQPQRPGFTFWNSGEEQKAWSTSSPEKISEWQKLASGRRMDWLTKALKHVQEVLAEPEHLVRWKSANANHIDALGPKQKEHLLKVFQTRLTTLSQKPLQASGEEPNYDADTGQIDGEDEIPGDFGPRQ